MPETIGIETYPSTACAVFKIDLKGRFVYIDDETEELFGSSREELFGKSLYDFITPETHRQLDAVFQRHSRYELFFESVPLMIHTESGMQQLDAVVTVNFISGNPVNHQFILKLSETSPIEPTSSWERMFLDVLLGGPEEIDFNHLASACSSASGYSTAECYIADSRSALKMVGAFPPNNPGHTAPAYLEKCRETGEDRFSFRPGDVARHEGFGDGRSEALLFLWYNGGKNLVIRLTGPHEYHPSDPQIRNIELFTGMWNKHAEQNGKAYSIGDKLSLIGRAGNALGFGVAVVNEDFDIVYANDSFIRSADLSDRPRSERNLRDIASKWIFRDMQSRRLTFDESPFGAVMKQDQTRTGFMSLTESSGPITLLAAPLEMDGVQLYLYCLTGQGESPDKLSPAADVDDFELLSLIHDIRAPLITIEAFTRKLQSRYADRLDGDATFLTDSIIENGRILQQMIDGLNELSRSRNDDEAPQDVYLKELVKEITQDLKAAYPGVSYRIKPSVRLPSIKAPKRKLTVLLRNILDNAFKYTAPVSEPQIEIEYALEAGQHRIQVSDNGPGIDPGYAEKIFAPFFRTPEALTTQGCGIGLALARDIITAWSGEIWVERPEQPGMRIAFTLPPEISK